MSTREIVIVAAFLISIIIMVFAFKKLNELEISGSRKSVLIYVTLICPLLGLILINRNKGFQK